MYLIKMDLNKIFVIANIVQFYLSEMLTIGKGRENWKLISVRCPCQDDVICPCQDNVICPCQDDVICPCQDDAICSCTHHLMYQVCV